VSDFAQVEVEEEIGFLIPADKKVNDFDWSCD